MKKLLLMLAMFAPLAAFAQTAKFGHLNAQEVMQSMPEFTKARSEMEVKAKEFDDELKAMQDELQRQVDEYDKTKSTMNETTQKETETKLQDLYTKFQQAQSDYSQQLQKEQQEKMTPITTKLVEAIKNVGKNGGYVYIMDVSSGIPYISDTLSTDVTNDVKKELLNMK